MQHSVFIMHLRRRMLNTVYCIYNKLPPDDEYLFYWKYVHIYIYILIRSNAMQQYAGVYLLQNYSTCFGCLSHPSSVVHQTVTAASGTGHSVRATTFCQRGLWPRWQKVVALTL